VPIYVFKCDRCGENKEVLRQYDDTEREERCVGCDTSMSRNYCAELPSPVIDTIVGGEYNVGLPYPDGFKIPHHLSGTDASDYARKHARYYSRTEKRKALAKNPDITEINSGDLRDVFKDTLSGHS